MPHRISIERKPGWRIPKDAVFVGKPSRWANPFEISAFSPAEALARFREYAEEVVRRDPWWLMSISGRDLACHCKAGEMCHADVLLEIANSGSLAGGKMLRLDELLE